MKYFSLVWAGLWRKKTRTTFTMISVVIAFLLFGLLQGINQGFSTSLAKLGSADSSRGTATPNRRASARVSRQTTRGSSAPGSEWESKGATGSKGAVRSKVEGSGWDTVGGW